MNKSLKNDLLKILLLSSFLPLLLVTIYSSYSFNKFSDNQITENLKSGHTNLLFTIRDLKEYLEKFSRKNIETKSFSFLVNTQAKGELRLKSNELIKNSLLDAVVVSKGSEIIFEVATDEDVKFRNFISKCSSKYAEIFYPSKKGDLYFGICLSEFASSEHKVFIFVKLEKSLLDSLKQRSYLDFVLLKNGKVYLSSLEDLQSYPAEFFVSRLKNRDTFNIEYKGSSYKFLFKSLFANDQITVGVGKNLERQKEALYSVERGLALASTILVIIFIPILFFLSRNITKPLQRLNSAVDLLSTENKRIELSVERSDEIGSLTKSFNEMSSALKQAQSNLVQSEKMASLGQLVAGVAHEINNPISFIKANMEPLKEYTKILLSKKEINKEEFLYIKKDLPKILKSIEEGTNRTTEIVRSLKSFSHQDKGERVELDLNQEIENLLVLMKSEFGSRIVLKKTLNATTKVKVNRNEINQVLINLLTNAIQAITENGEIEVATKETTNELFISISDTGSGILENDLDKIFEPFFTTKDVGLGTGLGLSISYNIIKNHKGDIKVESRKAKGTKFTISLPV